MTLSVIFGFRSMLHVHNIVIVYTVKSHTLSFSFFKPWAMVWFCRKETNKKKKINKILMKHKTTLGYRSSIDTLAMQPNKRTIDNWQSTIESDGIKKRKTSTTVTTTTAKKNFVIFLVLLGVRVTSRCLKLRLFIVFRSPHLNQMILIPSLLYWKSILFSSHSALLCAMWYNGFTIRQFYAPAIKHTTDCEHILLRFHFHYIISVSIFGFYFLTVNCLSHIWFCHWMSWPLVNW